jgi:predicted NBD/HSP70 family sugar kinase
LAAERTRAAINAAYDQHGLAPERMLGIGVSVSGPVAPDGKILHSSILPGWAGVNVIDVFQPVLGKPVHADNESNCAAVAEMTWGAAQGAEDFILFKIDLGVGGAIVQGGRILTGVAGGAGEFGHICIDPEGELCRCGNRGCLELAASFNRPLARLSERQGRALTMADAIALAKAGDATALAAIADVGRAAGFGLAIISTILNPPLIIVAGEMALAGELILGPLRHAYDKHVMIKPGSLPANRWTRIVTGAFTETDSLLGAFGLVLRDMGRLGQHEKEG